MNAAPIRHVGHALRALRRIAGLSVEQIAREAGVPARRLRAVEAGGKPPSPAWVGAVAEAIARHLGAPEVSGG